MNLAPLAILVSLSTAPLSPLPADQALLKLSIKLRGHGPTLTEKQAFRAASAGGEGAFRAAFAAKADEYLDSEEFAGVIEAAHTVWWRMPPGPSSKLARYIVASDRPYDEILAKDYAYLNGDEASAASAQGIQVDGMLPGPGDPYRAVALSPQEIRYRSIFSNRDFVDTFPDTPTNKNRKRANQVFRSFLCETLAPPATKHGASLVGDDPHGSDPACIGCHYRLDPMARFFDHWRPAVLDGLSSYYDQEQAAAGAVVFPGGGVRVDGAGESDLGMILKERPEWRRCVAQRSWAFAFGPALRVDEATLAGITLAFDGSGRRLKAALKTALMHPYFWSTSEPPPVNFADASPVFKQCGCHGRQVPLLGPDSYPWDADPAANALTIKRLWHAVNGHAGFKRMPPEPRPVLAAEEIAILREWIAAGALDTAFKATLTGADIEEILND